MSKVKRARVKIDKSQLVQLVSDAAMAGPVADGRLIPVLVIDTDRRPDIQELIRQHQYLQPGDAKHQWATSRDNGDRVMLVLTFSRPSDVGMVLPFSIEREGILVDSMIRSGAVYLQAGSAGDRLSSTLDHPRLLIELPETGFGPHWESLFENRMTCVMADRLRVPRRKAKPSAKQLITELRQTTSIRIRS